MPLNPEPHLADVGDLIARAVGAAGVAHAVTVVAVGVHLQDNGTLLQHPCLGKGHGLWTQG